MVNQALAEALQGAGAVKFGQFELSNGGTSDYYIDKYLFATDPYCLKLIAEEFAKRIDNTKLAGVAVGAVPLVTATSMETGNPYVIARKAQKEYGTGNRIEGRLEEGETVVVLEDITTTGKSAFDAVEALRNAGAVVKEVQVVVDREDGARELLNQHNVELTPLLTASKLLEIETNQKSDPLA